MPLPAKEKDRANATNNNNNNNSNNGSGPGTLKRPHSMDAQYPSSSDSDSVVFSLPAVLMNGSSQPTAVVVARQDHPHPLNPRESVLQRLSEALLSRSLTKMDLSQRGLQPSDARLVKMALLQNSHLTVLKLGYNNLEDTGACILADGLCKHRALESLDLGFNNIGDEGCCAIARAIRSSMALPLQTLYLAGNLIRLDGALGLADMIREQKTLKKLFLTGNCLGPDGICAITQAMEIVEQKSNLFNGSRNNSNSNIIVMNGGAGGYIDPHQVMTENGDTTMEDEKSSTTTTTTTTTTSSPGMVELFLGGTAVALEGCRAVARLLRVSTHLEVISLPNCDLTDDDVWELANSLKANRDGLNLRSLQLSFNRITAKGVEHVVNAVWGSTSLRELLLDNNAISDRGAQHLASVLPSVENMELIDVSFCGIKAGGIKHFMTAVAETNLKTVSLSGNALDTTAAKSVAYALAFNHSLVSLNLVNCSTEQNILRQIAAGIVSNKKSALRDLTGFELAPLVVSLGFPDAVGHWTNECVLNFLHLMWEKYGNDFASQAAQEEEEISIDPLHFLPGKGPNERHIPAPASTVVEVAEKAFQSLMEEGSDVFSRRPGHPKDSNVLLQRNRTFVMEVDDDDPSVYNMNDQAGYYIVEENGTAYSNNLPPEHVPSSNTKSFVSPPEKAEPKQTLPDPGRKRAIVEWLCKNIQKLNQLAQLPFNSAELWRLHQHYFTPVVNESGGSISKSLKGPLGVLAEESESLTISSVPEVSRTTSSSENTFWGYRDLREDPYATAAISDPSMKKSPATTSMGAFSALKRKGSYRSLGDAALLFHSISESGARGSTRIQATMSMPRKTKRARQNRSRISFLPRIKAKLDSFLDVCHEKALVVMRQLYFVEHAILNGEVNPIDPTKATRTHLSGDHARDAEMIIMDMI